MQTVPVFIGSTCPKIQGVFNKIQSHCIYLRKETTEKSLAKATPLTFSWKKPGHRVRFCPLKPKIKAHGGTVWEQLISWTSSRKLQDFLLTEKVVCVCVCACACGRERASENKREREREKEKIDTWGSKLF